VTERTLENIQLATKALLSFTIPFGLFFAIYIIEYSRYGWERSSQYFEDEPTFGESPLGVFALGLLFLAIILPVVILRREFQNRRFIKEHKKTRFD
jgi:hypothetical protein